MGQWQAAIDVPAAVHGPASARRLVGVLLPMWGLAQYTEHAQLVISELVTNALQHAPGTDSFEFEVIGFPDRVRMSLADGSSIRPVIAELDNARPSGRGLRIVEALSARWGSDDHNGGKRVWVELDPTTHGSSG
jgi:anti-sigma regulatory factor (Ser/Thr protein kinase)